MFNFIVSFIAPSHKFLDEKLMTESAEGKADFDLGPPEYLVYRVLWELRENTGGETGRTKFHKLCILADKKLNEKYDRDIGLPQYWYKYGKTLAESEIDDAVTFTPHSNHRRGFAYYPAEQVSESDFDHLDEDLKDDIFQATIEIVDEHGEKNYKELEKYQYENFPPHKFVTAYGNFRWYLSSISLDRDQKTIEHFTDPSEKSTIEELLDEMLVSFDEREFEEIYDLYLDWDDTVRLLNEEGASARELLDFTETFIEAIAKAVLRFKDRSHISEDRLSKWEEEKEKVLKDLESKIQRRRESALSGRSMSRELRNISDSYNETISDELEDL
ncbi:hypothetical protein [Halobellus ordinarius]|uniref:hypothetical protein n=1 Tax=Halobellus ordinarius TaxID=3075120 RepID=UPI0028808051|nr:hypothetical protein [Halobellus sp. ZY16]